MYEVYAYWNVAELEAMFNAVASLMGSGDYRGLLQTIAIVGMIVVVIATDRTGATGWHVEVAVLPCHLSVHAADSQGDGDDH
jgi:hypothetical protein